MKKRWLSLALALVFCLSLVPGVAMTARAAGPDLYVCGVQVTDENKSDILGDGTAKLEGTTLTLSGFANVGVGHENAAIYSSMSSLTVQLTGNNAVVCDSLTYGIYSTGSVTFTGSGRLAISGGTEPVHADSVTVASGFTGTLVVQGGIVSGESAGITANSVNVQSGTVLATGGFSSTASSGVKGAVSVSGGVLYAQGGETTASSATSYGISGNTTVNGGAVVVRAGLIHPKGTSYPDDQFASANRRAISGTLTTSGASVAAKVGYSSSSKTSYSTAIENANATGIFIVGNGYSSASDLPSSVTGDIYHVETTYNTFYSTSSSDLNIEEGKTALFVSLVENGENSSDDIYGLKINGGSLTVSGGGTLIGIGGIATDDYSYGIYTNSDLAVDGSAVIGVGGPSEGYNYGIYVNSKLTIASGSITGVGGQTFYDRSSYGLYVSGKTSASGTACVLGLGGDQLDYSSYGYRGNYDYGIEIRDQAQVFGIGGDTADYDSTGIDGTVNAYGGVAAGIGGRSYGTSEGFDDGFYCYYGGRVVGMASTSTNNSGSQGAWGVGEIGGTVVLSGQTSAVSSSGTDVFPVGDWCDMVGYSDSAGTAGKTTLTPGTATYNEVKSYKRIETKPFGEPYDLWVGGVHVLNTNRDDITAVINDKQAGAASGTAVYTPATGDAPAKLKLNNFNFSGTGYHKAWRDDYRTYDAYCSIYTTSSLEIVLTGDNTVIEASAEPANGRMSYGIRNDPAVRYGDSPALTFSGTGTLTAKSADCTYTNVERGNETAGIYLSGALDLKGTVSVTGISGNVDTTAEVRSVSWAFGKEPYLYGVNVDGSGITTKSGTTLRGVGGNLTLRDNLGENPTPGYSGYQMVVLEGYSYGIRGAFQNAAGTVEGIGGNIALHTQYGNDGSKTRYLRGYSYGAASSNGQSNLSGSFSAAGGALTLNIPADNVQNMAESYGLYASTGGGNSFTYSGSEFTARGDTSAIHPRSGAVNTQFDSVHTILTNTSNDSVAATEGTITTGAVPTTNGTDNYKYIKIFSPYTVTVTAGENMTRDTTSGAATQYVTAGGDMTAVVYTADEGYYFPTDYTVAAVNGITVTRDSYMQITVSGTPTADAVLTLTAPTAKAKLDTPAAVFTANGPDSGALTISAPGTYRTTYLNKTGQAEEMNITQEGETSWPMNNIGAGDLTVVRAAIGEEGNTRADSDPQTISVTKAATPSLKPTQPTEAGGTGSIPTTDAHEFSTDGTTWMPCDGATEELPEETYYVRTAASGTVLTSDAQTITIKYTAPAPSSGGGTTTYPVTAPAEVENAEVTVTPKNAFKGQTVTVTVTPDEGYKVESVTVTDSKGNEIEVTDNGDGTYSFKMPASKVAVTPVIVEIEDEPVPTANRPFVDVAQENWFYDAVYHCYDNGYFQGVDDIHFSPQDTMTRAMFATVLYRIAGEPKAAGEHPFTDVDADTWYTDAVIWTVGEKIIEGYGDGRFGTEDPVTREQLVTLFWRYQGKPSAENANLSDFTDTDQISGWAQDAFAWAVEAGVISGKGNGVLDPKGTATRSEVAQIVINYDTKAK